MDYERDLDLNLLRVFVVVVEEGSATQAAQRLYVTQPAVSAALQRLSRALGTELFVRSGRGLMLTARGRALYEQTRGHLQALIHATSASPVFDPKTSRRVVKLGLADANDAWVLPALLTRLLKDAPGMRIVVLRVQFRNIAELLMTDRIDLAVTVADELPEEVLRQSLFVGGFVALFDRDVLSFPRRLTKSMYLAQKHVIVSYNGDLRGIVEDMFGLQRDIVLSLPTFQSIVSVLPGQPLIATVPKAVADYAMQLAPTLGVARLPFRAAGAPMELLWRAAFDDDPALVYIRGLITSIAESEGVSRSFS